MYLHFTLLYFTISQTVTGALYKHSISPMSGNNSRKSVMFKLLPKWSQWWCNSNSRQQGVHDNDDTVTMMFISCLWPATVE